jgi:hypothetical protein
MNWILKLYPREWQRRYGDEIAEVVAAQPNSIQLTVDLIGGAIDAHLKPQAFARRLEEAEDTTKGGHDMASRLWGCGSKSPMSRKEAMIGASITLGTALLVAGALMLIDHPATETIVLVMTPGVLVVGSQWMYSRGHSTLARIGLVGGPFVILFLIGVATVMLQQRVG